MYLQAVVICCLFIAHSSLCYDDVHHVMTRREINVVFQTRENSAPRHELVRIVPEPTTKTYSRKNGKVIVGATDRVWLKTFGAKINLWLHPTENVLMHENTPVYHAQYSETEPGNVKFEKQDGAMKRIGELFVSRFHRASLVIGTDPSGELRVNGHIGSHGLTVRSVPERVVKEYLRTRRSINEPEHILSNASYVVVYETPESINEELFPAGLHRTNVRERTDRWAEEEEEEIPYTLYPQILVVVENSLYIKLGNSETNALEYLLAFWNGVDLHYRNLERPRIRFSISGIIIATEPLGTPYISRYSWNDTIFDADSGMLRAKNFFSEIQGTFPLDTYDIPVTMTSLLFGGPGRTSFLTVGLAYPGQTCVRTFNTVEGVTIVRDMADFLGIHIAAHELGHCLGMRHDIDHYDDNCKDTDNYTMTRYLGRYDKSWQFSQCSLDDFDTLLHNNGLKCLYNVPVITGKSLPRIMPGKFMSPFELCKANGYENVCHSPSELLCDNLMCCGKDKVCERTRIPIPEGAPCGSLENMFCLRRRCTQIPQLADENA